MAIVNTNSTRVAADLVKGSNRPSIGKDLQLIEGRLESVSGDSIGSTYRLCTLPSDFVIDKIELANDALGGSCAADLGIYKALGGAVVDADLFGSAISLVSAAGWTQQTEEASATDIDKSMKPLWERAGLTKNGGQAYDVVLTLTGASAAAGTVAIKVRGYYLG